MDFGIQILVSVGLALTVGLALYYFAKKRWNILNSKNVDFYLLLLGFIMITIAWLPYCFNEKISYLLKFRLLVVGYVGGVFYWFITRPSKKKKSE